MDQKSLNQVGCMIIRMVGLLLIIGSIIAVTSTWIHYELVRTEEKSGWTHYPPLEELANQEEDHSEKHAFYRLSTSIYVALFSIIVGIVLLHFSRPLGKLLAKSSRE